MGSKRCKIRQQFKINKNSKNLIQNCINKKSQFQMNMITTDIWQQQKFMCYGQLLISAKV